MRGTVLGATAALLFGATTAWPLDPGLAITQYRHDVWNTKHGLPQSSVEAILQTQDGYLWLGTQEGLARFDGTRFTVFDKANTPALRHAGAAVALPATGGSPAELLKEADRALYAAKRAGRNRVVVDPGRQPLESAR